MKVEQILKKITRKEKKKEIERINKTKLPKDLQEVVDTYEMVCGERDIFFWKWIYIGVQETALWTSNSRYKKSNWKCEFFLVMFLVIFDYIVDRKKSSKLLNELLKIPFIKNQIKFNKLNKQEKKIVAFAIEIWCNVEKIVKSYPGYERFREIWNFDISQIINAMKYDCIVSKNNFLINKTEYWQYAPHTMQVVASTTFGLMCTPGLNLCELGFIREVSLKIQKMARISNWISTWEREIDDNDFTSGVFAYALKLNLFTPDELKKENKEEIVNKIKKADIEKILMNDWNKYYFEVCKYKIKSIDIHKFLFGEERALILYMIAKGRI